MKKSKISFLARAALIAALYVVLTAAFPSSASGVIQLRISEALAFLPFFNAAAIPGLAVGCFISNIITLCVPFDVVLGTLATLIGAVFAWLMGRLARNSKNQVLFAILATLPNVIANMLIVPWVLKFAYGATEAVPFMMLTVGISELAASTLLGAVVILAFRKNFKLLK